MNYRLVKRPWRLGRSKCAIAIGTSLSVREELICTMNVSATLASARAVFALLYSSRPDVLIICCLQTSHAGLRAEFTGLRMDVASDKALGVMIARNCFRSGRVRHGHLRRSGHNRDGNWTSRQSHALPRARKGESNEKDVFVDLIRVSGKV
jgi:hypothetical protein